MKEKISNAFLVKKKKSLLLMTHIVAGFPSFEMNLKTIQIMQNCGVHLIEIQFPFSDPIADGPTITSANQFALNQGVSTHACFEFLKKISKSIKIPLVGMSYYNLPLHFGIENFFQLSQQAGLSGLIIPDLPFDSSHDPAPTTPLAKIQVASPGISKLRLQSLCHYADTIVYATLKVGTTGSKQNLSQIGSKFLAQLRNATKLPIVAGFGIASPQQLLTLKNTQLVDAAVIGSYLIDLLQLQNTIEPQNQKLQRLETFLLQCIAACQ